MILLHRSPIEVIQTGYIGYGWKHVNFSEYQNINELLVAFKEKYPKANRHHNMIRRFFNLKVGDIVIIPIPKAIIIGEVVGDKKYFDNIPYGNNQVKVNFFKNNGNLIKINNYRLSTALQARLRVQQTNVSLDQDFTDEINQILASIKKIGNYDNNILFQQETQAIESFKINLLKNIQENKVWLKAGGRGLEELIKKLLEIDGYQAKICAKNQSNGIDDIDIIAFKDDRFFSYKLLIQVKHHQGTSNSIGVKQLNEYQDDNNNTILKKLLITTANHVNETAENLANENNIQIMLGAELVDWIYDSLPKLSQSTKEELGIFESYQLVNF